MRVSKDWATAIPLTLTLSREGRGIRFQIKAVNTFVLVEVNILLACENILSRKIDLPKGEKGFVRISS